ncbi:MAG TPA: glycoside hydrolase family 57 protein [Candidatus Saccharimonadia bacterium]
MRAICLYMHVHQPFRVRPYTIFDASEDHDYFSNPESQADNHQIMRKVAEKSYLPTNAALMELIKRHPQFKLSLSLSGTVLEQMQLWAPEALESFKELVATGRVEIVAETYHHSLAFFYDREEFERQVKLHAKTILHHFGVKPRVFRNTELSYNNELAHWADKAGYKAIITEGWEPVLGWRSPNYVYRPAFTKQIRLLMKNYQLSDDVAFRFSNRAWSGWPLTAEKYVGWLNDLDADQTNVNLFMDYETFGEHQWAETGIYDFLKHMTDLFLSSKGNTFMTLSEAAKKIKPSDYIDVPQTITWADTERDLSAWVGNSMQRQAINSMYQLSDEVLATRDAGLIEDWRRLQASDHFYYMCTKWFNDGDIHAYFSPYSSPYDAFIYFMNALRDVKYRVAASQGKL